MGRGGRRRSNLGRGPERLDDVSQNRDTGSLGITLVNCQTKAGCFVEKRESALKMSTEGGRSDQPTSQVLKGVQQQRPESPAVIIT